jgi:hypothetical protein
MLNTFYPEKSLWYKIRTEVSLCKKESFYEDVIKKKREKEKRVKPARKLVGLPLFILVFMCSITREQY